MRHPRLKGSVRRGQLVTTYGVGAVVAVEDESFMVAGLDRWDVGMPNVHEPRLERDLNVRGFALPPDAESGKHVPVVRFPTIYSCPKCRRLERHRFFCGHAENRCNVCKTVLVPSRFVVVCGKGHIDDFPYFDWVHAGTRPPDGERTKHILSIDSTGVSASLKDIVIRCSCGKASTMHGAFGKDALRSVLRNCSGRRPWLGDEEPCGETPRTLQRGASNGYFAISRSAISIPPWSEGAFKTLNKYWTALRHIPNDALAGTIQGMGLAAGTGFTVDDLVDAVRQRKAVEQGDGAAGEAPSLLEQEYDALVRGKSEISRTQEFVCEPAQGIDADVQTWFDAVMLVKRLREVRALESFTRLLPLSPGDPPDRRAPLTKEPPEWLPAVEVQGEGVFLRLEEERLDRWERRSNVTERAARLSASLRPACSSFIRWRTYSSTNGLSNPGIRPPRFASAFTSLRKCADCSSIPPRATRREV